MSINLKDLILDIETKKKELGSMKLQNSIGELKDNSKIGKLKLTIAKLSTTASQMRREENNG
jgi:ribosomal protein L29